MQWEIWKEVHQA